MKLREKKTYQDIVSEPVKIKENPDGSVSLDMDYLMDQVYKGIPGLSEDATARKDAMSQGPAVIEDAAANGWRVSGLGNRIYGTRAEAEQAAAWAKSSAAGASWDSWSQDSMRAHVSPKSKASRAWIHDGGYGRVWDPTADPLAASRAAADGRWAVMGADGQVYVHDVYPSISRYELIKKAADILRRHKRLNITRLNSSLEPNGKDMRVIYAVINTVAPEVDQGKLMEIILPAKCFERRGRHQLDDYAKIKDTMDTDTYLALRIAYLLFNAYKLNDKDALSINLDIIKILGHTTKPVYHF